ncbi:DUF5330 domain-containing protein [Pannonibacter carbonis]|uniref:DUF5330 domain-containing protein n=1 Tax=Pannonibacter carbonis TaxID=2067569 RepID=UPI000D102F3F|nr:DUF5330 domain-containing protein [Pannonibacter carbonis]
MFFLIRTAFWLTLVLVLIPFGTGQKTTTGIDVDPLSAVLAAQATVSDLTGFCTRNPQTCDTGGQALVAIGAQARDGARIVYEFLDKSVEGTDLAAPQTSVSAGTPVFTGSVGGNGPMFAADPVPAWHLPAPETVPGAASVAPAPASSTPEVSFGPVPRPNPRSGSRV